MVWYLGSHFMNAHGCSMPMEISNATAVISLRILNRYQYHNLIGECNIVSLG